MCCCFLLMIRRPPISTRTDTLFPYTTLFRSLLDAAGLAPFAGMQGVSLWALLRDSTGTAPPRPDVYSEYYNAMPWHRDPTAQATMLRTARYKLVAVHSLGTGELYDLDRDAAETRNL